jgi:hypothetical protein
MSPAVHNGGADTSSRAAVSRAGIPFGNTSAAGHRPGLSGAAFRGVAQLEARQVHNLEVVGSNPTPATIYRRRGRARVDHSLRFLGRCPNCGQIFTGAVEALVRTSINGHHYYTHGYRLTDAELDVAVQELVSEKELAESNDPQEPLL